VVNALGAAAAAFAAGFTLDEIVRGLAHMRPAAGRMVVCAGPRGSLLVDDTYNANPAALRAAIDYVTRLEGEAWLALGDMGELGPESERFHAAAGRYAREQGIARLFAFGPKAAVAAETFGSGECFETIEALAEKLKAELGAGVTLLVKGSRAMRLERLVQALTAPERS
jgi:UDP-N-acetylmuramoyl-tripeptide--D-alanyl-D-alanine ligase